MNKHYKKEKIIKENTFTPIGIGNMVGSSHGASVPAAPTGLTATVISDTRIDLAWTGTGDVKRSTDGVTYSVIASGQTDSYSNTGLTAGTLYYYKISNAGGNSNVAWITPNLLSIPTKSLLHFEGADTTTVFTDETGRVWTPHADAQIDTAQKKFGNSSVYFDGTGDYIDTPDSEDFHCATEDFTIDFWARRASINSVQYICGQLSAAGSSLQNHIGFNADNTITAYLVNAAGTTIYDCTSVIVINDITTFHHIALERYGNQMILFIDGVIADTADLTGATLQNSTAKFAIGRSGQYDGSYFNGWIDEFRFTKGEARWTADFSASLPSAVYALEITVSRATLSLTDPYTNVVKITATSASEFKLNINKGLVFSKQDIFDEIDSVQKLNADEDKITSIYRWIVANQKGGQNYTGELVPLSNIINCINSYPYPECSGIAMVAFAILNHYYPGLSYVYSRAGHVENGTSTAYMDCGFFRLWFKDKYVHASLTELKADRRLVDEPLRNSIYPYIVNITIPSAYPTADAEFGMDGTALNFDNNIDAMLRSLTYELTSVVDYLSMRLPATATVVMPVKSAKIPIIHWYAYEWDMTNYANAIVTIPTGATGIVKMPLTLLNIRGTGTITLDGTNYTLPDDEATIETKLQTYDEYYNTFTINTNTGGIVADFLINAKRLMLMKSNIIDLLTISGSVTFESVSTAIPIPTYLLNLNKGTANFWTITHALKLAHNDTFKLPIADSFNQAMDNDIITFLGTTNNPAPVRNRNAVADSTSIITAGTEIIDKCFASKLTPADDTFASSLELTFTSFDTSDTYYTLDGTTPDATKTLYTAPFTITATKTVKWINIKTDYANSHVNTRVITKT
jgi:hypothetical protein